MSFFTWFFLCILGSAVNYLLITTLVDWLLMGIAVPHFSKNHFPQSFSVTQKNRIDFQQNLECSAFSSAYILRHFGLDANGKELYQIMPNKMKSGYVYPKGICNLLNRYGLYTKYRIGNLNALKKEVSKGNPVIVLIRIEKSSKALHYVPVVGYNEKEIYLAESLEYLSNCEEKHYNRKIAIQEFKMLWNTSMLKMPLYRNTYIAVEKKT